MLSRSGRKGKDEVELHRLQEDDDDIWDGAMSEGVDDSQRPAINIDTEEDESDSSDEDNDGDLGPDDQDRGDLREITLDLTSNLPDIRSAQSTEALSPEESPVRRIYLNNDQNSIEQNRFARFPKNSIHTTKYRWWNFVAKNLYEQFHRLANFFFLVTAILTLLPELTNIDPVSSVAPLVFVLGVTMAKEAFEDWKRMSSDNEVNNRIAQVFVDGRWKSTHWKDIQVGDILKVSKNEEIPADLVILNSSLEMGLCYVQTANLDGETNLKLRQSLKETTKLKTHKQLQEWRGFVECEQPNKDLYNFDGRILVKGKTYPLSNTQVLYRGVILKNTDWIYGLAVFTGYDTKLRMNSRDPPSKRSTLEKDMNRGLLYLFLFMFCISALCAIAYTLSISSDDWYLAWENDDLNAFFNLVLLFLSYAILYSYMIPISLYVSMELVKLAQTYFIDQDINMYDEKTDTPAKAKTSNLNEELGQIDFIFSDKTGTLTSNEMELVRCSVDGVMYSLTEGKDDPEDAELKSRAEMLENAEDFIHGPNIREFFSLLAVCHTVIPEVDSRDKSKIIYQSASPDEYALVDRAAALGFKFVDRSFDEITVEILGNERKYRTLALIEFTNERKRMSIICRTPEGNIRLFIKGADSAIYPRLSRSPEHQERLRATNQHLEKCAGSGLRTLCCAYADLDEHQFNAWYQKFEAASNSLTNRKKMVEAVAEEIEKDLILLGATAIEDKLQDEVPETIYDLRKANLKIWVLTGDKPETAINIGYSCHLLTDLELLQIYESQQDDTRDNSVEDRISRAFTQIIETQSAADNGLDPPEFALVVEGQALKYVLDDGKSGLESRFMQLALACKTVICSRVSPDQKRALVACVRKYLPKVRTLAIGDGANDVSMIQEAHVGIGIYGKEGMQAAMNSDYAIGQFKFLKDLLLVHGRWNYNRTAKLVNYSFYKNITLSMCLFWFTIFSKFSAQNFFDSYSLALFNLVFASMPVLCYAVFNQDVKDRSVIAHPELYRSGQQSTEFNVRLLASWVGFGIYNSVVIYFGLLLYFGDGIINSQGSAFGLWSLGTIAYTVVILVITCAIAIETTYWTTWNWVAMIGSVLAWFVYSIIYSSICYFSTTECYVLNHLYETPTFWFCIVILSIVSILPAFTYQYIQRHHFPKSHHIIQEIQFAKRGEKKKARKELGRRQTVVKITGTAVPQSAAHTGYAFAQDEDSAKGLQLAITSLFKKTLRRKARQERKDSDRIKRRSMDRQRTSQI